MSSAPRILVASTHNLGAQLYNVLTFEMSQVLVAASDADVLAPGPRHRGIPAELLTSFVSGSRRAFGLRRSASLARAEVDADYDLFVYICLFPRQLSELSSIRGWRKRSRKAVVLMLETWSSQLERERAQLSVLDEFDQVVVFNRTSLPRIQSYTRTPCTFMPPATDCLSATPFPANVPRSIDVYSMGRRSDPTHRQLLSMAQRSEIFYMFDVGSGLQVHDFAQARFLTFELIRRSRYFIAYNHSVGPKAAESAGEHALPTRLFEGAAAGAVMIGSPPRCPEYEEVFNWPDAVIEIPEEPKDMRAILAELDADPARMERARYLNATEALRGHDWIYRWSEIFTHLGFDPPAGFAARKRRLKALADDAERIHSPIASRR